MDMFSEFQLKGTRYGMYNQRAYQSFSSSPLGEDRNPDPSAHICRESPLDVSLVLSLPHSLITCILPFCTPQLESNSPTRHNQRKPWYNNSAAKKTEISELSSGVLDGFRKKTHGRL